MSEEFYKRRSRFYYAFLLTTIFENDRDMLQKALDEFSAKGKELKKEKQQAVEADETPKKKVKGKKSE